jgi:hypothetical protein
MKINKAFILGVLAVWCTLPLLGLDNGGVDLSMRLYDKRIYYPETEIRVLIEITNNTGETYRFKAAQNRLFNLSFQVSTLTNEPIQRSEQFITALERNQQVFYRDVDLEPGERYSFVANLKDFMAVEDAGAYVARAVYHPDLRSGTLQLQSNAVSFTVRPSAGSMGISADIDQMTGEILRRNPLPPDEVVEYFIQSRQKGEWNKFFLYLDLESIYLTNPQARNRFTRSSESDRMMMLEAYREDLMARETRDEIVQIPSSYEILETRYTPENGTVEVVERFDNTDFVEVKQFTYYLDRRDGVWMISAYDVRNLGTE